jgi:hypothetical protein
MFGENANRHNSHPKRLSRSTSDLVVCATKEITRIVNNQSSTPTHKSLFFKLVRGGNVAIIREVLLYLH